MSNGLNPEHPDMDDREGAGPLGGTEHTIGSSEATEERVINPPGRLFARMFERLEAGLRNHPASLVEAVRALPTVAAGP